MEAEKRLESSIIERLREAVSSSFGNEVLAVGVCNGEGVVYDTNVVARGDAEQVPALYPYMEKGDVVIHNHPSGALSPSKADLEVASRLGNQGIGFFIINNEVTRVYVVTEPVLRQETVFLDSSRILGQFQKKASRDGLIPDFHPREEQQAMLESVCRALNDDEVAVIEAGTGVGKSFAYLLPAAEWALSNKERVIISTNTINLQHQLIEKDIPVIQKILGKTLKGVLAKGRSNYLCLRRLNEAVLEPELFPEQRRDLQNLIDWSKKTVTGSKSDLSFYPSPQLWQMVCSESDSCVGLRCSDREGCFVIRARKEVAGADLIVANHHLLFSDIAMRIEEVGFETTAVLPPCKRFIYDEAHTLEESATSFFSSTVNRFILGRQLQRLGGKRRSSSGGLLLKLEKLAKDKGKISKTANLIAGASEHFDALEAMTLARLAENKHLLIRREEREEGLFYAEAFSNFHSALLSLLDHIIGIYKGLPADSSETAEVYEFETIIRRLELIAEHSHVFMESSDFDSNIYWIERSSMPSGGYFITYNVTPLDVSQTIRDAVFEPAKTVVCTSATLTVGKSFENWISKMGLSDRLGERVQTLLLGSPFPFETNALLSVPTDAPDPKNEHYIDYTVKTVREIVFLSEGSALVLFTSYTMLNTVYEALRDDFAGRNITCMRQGDDDRTKLLNRFTREISSVLFATDSFWQGVDAPGDTCRVVILCRLPFRVPTDPVVEARMAAMVRKGKNPFMEMSLPDAVIRLRQGFGRLIRSRNDSGVVVILDNRVLHKSYGSIFLESLPKTRFSFRETAGMLEDVENFLYRKGN